MFFSVIIGYVVVVAFAFCGVAATVEYVMEAPRDTTYTFFLGGLAVKMWPLAVSLALVLLIQIACQIEKLRLTMVLSQVMPPTPKAGKPAPIAPVPPAPGNVPSLTAVTPPVLTEGPDETTQASSVPIPLPPKPAPAPAGQPVPTPPVRPATPQQDGLNFFKLD